MSVTGPAGETDMAGAVDASGASGAAGVIAPGARSVLVASGRGLDELLLRFVGSGPVSVVNRGDRVVLLAEAELVPDARPGDGGGEVGLSTDDGRVFLGVARGDEAVLWALDAGLSHDVAAPDPDVPDVASVARAVAEALPGVSAAAVRDALDAPPAERLAGVMRVLDLPEEAADVLAGRRSPASVPTARTVALDSMPGAALDLAALDLDDPDGSGWASALYRAGLDRPWILPALAVVETGIGVVLGAGALRAGRRGKAGKGVATRGLVGALLLVDAASEIVVQRGVRRRLDRLRQDRGSTER